MVYPGKYFVYTLRRMRILLFGGAFYRCLLGLLSLWSFFKSYIPLLIFCLVVPPIVESGREEEKKPSTISVEFSISPLVSTYFFMHCGALIFGTYVYSVISSWCIKPFISRKYCSLFLVTFFSFKVYFVWYKYSQSSLLVVAIYMIIFFHSFNLSLSVSLNLKHVVFQQFIVVFSHCLTICLLLDCLIQSHLMLSLI